MKCIKEILPRQGGTPKCACFICAADSFVSKRNYTRAEDFSDELIKTKSDEWVALWQLHANRQGREEGMTAAEFEKSDLSKEWSSKNLSFAGQYCLPEVSIHQYMVDYLHLTLRLVPVIFAPIVTLASNPANCCWVCTNNLPVDHRFDRSW